MKRIAVIAFTVFTTTAFAADLSCTYSGDVPNSIACTLYQNLPKLASAGVREMCSMMKGTIKTFCPTNGVSGACQVGDNSMGKNVKVTPYFYNVPAESISDLKEACESDNGEWQ